MLRELLSPTQSPVTAAVCGAPCLQAQAERPLQERSPLLLSVASNGRPHAGPRVRLVPHQRSPSLRPCRTPLTRSFRDALQERRPRSLAKGSGRCRGQQQSPCWAVGFGSTWQA